MSSSNCRIVLVRPRDPNNIGAAARAMKNFGFTDLTVVTPHPPVWGEVVSAVNAEDVLANARVVQLLDEAISDCNRSEERRVGKECRSRWGAEQQKKKKKKRVEYAQRKGEEVVGKGEDEGRM